MEGRFLEECVGTVQSVLFETEENGMCTGHSDTYVLVSVPGTGLRNQVINVRITEICGEGLKGEMER